MGRLVPPRAKPGDVVPPPGPGSEQQQCEHCRGGILMGRNTLQGPKQGAKLYRHEASARRKDKACAADESSWAQVYCQGATLVAYLYRDQALRKLVNLLTQSEGL
jgi:hypothetical protein